MKPCADQQKLIAWLALGALDERSEQKLRAHLATCSGCRRYLAEISQVTEQLAAAEPDMQLPATEAFHRNVVARLQAETPTPIWEKISGALRPIFSSWRVALPVAAVAVVLLVVGIAQWPRTKADVRPVAPTITPAAVDTEANLAPTIANYQRVASESLDKLDALLGEQGKQTTRATPVYTAAESSLGF